MTYKHRLTFFPALLLLFFFNLSQPDEVPILAVIDLRAENIGESDARVITDYVEEAVFRTGKYILVERNQIRKVLEEYQLQQSGICEKECAVNIGRQLAAAKVIIGTVSKLGEVYSIQLKLIDVESAMIENIESIRKECTLGKLPDYIGIPVNKLVKGYSSNVSDVALKIDSSPGEEADRQEWREPVTGMEFVWVPAGEFDMGSKRGDIDQKLVRKVSLDGFWMGKYEVTQGQWQSIMGRNPSRFKSGDNYPVERVSWKDVQDFIHLLNSKTGMTFRLPTEAEWEYACRAGSTGDRYGYLEDIAWYSINSGGKTHHVGQKKPNAFRLYDMLGNVWEWCQDKYGSYIAGTERNPTGPISGSDRVNRGGSWNHDAMSARSTHRGYGDPSYRGDYIGFRLARTK